MNLKDFKPRFNIINTLTADDEYSRHNRLNVVLPIQMQLSQKPKPY